MPSLTMEPAAVYGALSSAFTDEHGVLAGAAKGVERSYAPSLLSSASVVAIFPMVDAVVHLVAYLIACLSVTIALLMCLALALLACVCVIHSVSEGAGELVQCVKEWMDT